MCKNPSPIIALFYLRGPWFDRFLIFTTWGCFYISSSFYALIIINSPFKEGVVLLLNKLEFFFYPMMLCANFGWNRPSGFEEVENVRNLWRRKSRRRQTTNKSWSEKLTWNFGSGELKSKQGLRKFDLFNLPECHREECFNIE